MIVLYGGSIYMYLTIYGTRTSRHEDDDKAECDKNVPRKKEEEVMCC